MSPESHQHMQVHRAGTLALQRSYFETVLNFWTRLVISSFAQIRRKRNYLGLLNIVQLSFTRDMVEKLTWLYCT